jgi:phage tail-like protein
VTAGTTTTTGGLRRVQPIETAKPASAVLSSLSPPPQSGFSECAGLDATMLVEEYREGGRNTGVLKFPGRIQHSSIKLRRGATEDTDLWDWHDSFLRGKGRRRDGIIELHDDTGEVVRSWRFSRGLPVKWVGPSLSGLQSAVAIEELEISHEGIIVRTLGAAGEIAATIGSIAESFGRA